MTYVCICATSNDEDLSYKIGCFIISGLFIPVQPVSIDCQGLSIPISEVYMHRSHYTLPSS